MRNRGFTLIELMIVVSIISILSAISVPNLLRYKQTAKEAQVISFMRQYHTAQIQFQGAAVNDANGDGTGDFGTLQDLTSTAWSGGVGPAFLEGASGAGMKNAKRGFYYGYVFVSTVVTQNKRRAGSFTLRCRSQRTKKVGGRSFFIDTSGVIRFTTDGTWASANSTPLA